jgi:cytoskeletal protein CcmA (bactofilin family)
MKRWSCLWGALLILLLSGLPAMAAPWELYGGVTKIDSRQVIAGDLFFSGDQLVITGTVNGDVIAFAREITVNGRVNGSIIGIITEKLIINGAVTGNVRAVANIFTLKGRVGRNLSAYALRMTTGRQSRITGGLLGTYGDLKLTGTINGPVEVRTHSTTALGGTIGGNVIAKGAPLQWLPPLRIAGRMDDYSGVKAKIPAAAKVIIVKGYHTHRIVSNFSFYYKYLFLISVIWFLGNLLMSLIFYRIFPRTAWQITEPTPARLKRGFLIGLLTLIIVPVVIVLLILTTVGLPIALVLLLLYLGLLLFANVPVSLLLGRIVLRQNGPGYPPRASWLIIIGCLISSVITALPVIGVILPACIGVGLIVQNIRPEYQEVQKER